LQGFLGSPHGFVVKAIHVEPAAEPAAAIPGAPGRPGAAPGPGPNPANTPPIRRPPPLQGGVPVPPAPVAGVPLAPPRPLSPDKPNVLLKERRLKVTLLVYAIRTLK